eukprot:6200926-Pleurochrysis_carterae.AAC.3
MDTIAGTCTCRARRAAPYAAGWAATVRCPCYSITKCCMRYSTFTLPYSALRCATPRRAAPRTPRRAGDATVRACVACVVRRARLGRQATRGVACLACVA